MPSHLVYADKNDRQLQRGTQVTTSVCTQGSLETGFQLGKQLSRPALLPLTPFETPLSAETPFISEVQWDAALAVEEEMKKVRIQSTFLFNSRWGSWETKSVISSESCIIMGFEMWFQIRHYENISLVKKEKDSNVHAPNRHEWMYTEHAHQK